MATTGQGHATHLANLSNHELFAMHGAFVAELKHRGIIRTANIIGEVGEHLALGMYGGQLTPAATKAVDLIDPNGLRIQVKTRAANRPESQLRVTVDATGSFDFCLVLMLDPANFKPILARHIGMDRIKELVDSGARMTIGSLRHEGIDVLAPALEAWALGQ